MSNLEEIMKQILDELHFRYIREYQVGKFSMDFFLPDFRIGIECDGEAYHNNQSTFKRDKLILMWSQGKIKRILHFSGNQILRTRRNVKFQIRNICH